MEKDERNPASNRRAFLTGATISISALVANSLAGCSYREPHPNDALRSEMDALRHIDPRLLTFRETSRIPTGLEHPTGLCAGFDGRLWAVGDAKLAEIGLSGPRCVHALPGDATCVSCGPDGLYVGLTDRIAVVRADGHVERVWDAIDSSAYLTAIDAKGARVWAADYGAKLARGFDPAGRTIGEIGGIIAPSPHFDVAIGPDGRIFVTNPGRHRVEMHAESGELLASWGAPASDLSSFCGCCNPTDFALLPGGGFVTAEKGIPRIKISDPRGKFVEVVAGPDELPSNAMSQDLAVLPGGRIAVLDPLAKAVRVFSRNAAPPQKESA